MPRSFTPEALAEINRRESAEAFLLLATISNPDLATPYRFVRNNADVVSRGMTFEARMFEWALPTDTEDGPQQVQFSFDNIDQDTTDFLRRTTSNVMVTIELISSARPDVVELTVGDLALKTITLTHDRVSGNLSHEDVMNLKYPGDIYNPLEYAGIF